MKILIRVGIAVAVLAVAGYSAVYIGLTGGLNRVQAAIEVGGEMPDFEMKCTNGETHTLEKYEGKVIVIEFASHLCPWSKAADKDFMALKKKYAEKEADVVFLGIDSHHEVTPEEIKAYQEESGKSYCILIDKDNKYADEVGANVTPEVVIIDREGKIRYHGAVDNRKAPTGNADEHYVADALAAVVAGEEVATATTRAWGCTIKRKAS